MQNITFHYKPNNFGSLILKHKSTGVTTASGYSARWVYDQPQKARYPYPLKTCTIAPQVYFQAIQSSMQRKNCKKNVVCNFMSGSPDVQHASRIVAPNTSFIQVFMLVQFGNVTAVLGSTITTKPIIPVLFYFWEVLIVIGHMVICNSGMCYLILQFLFMCNLESLKQQVHL